MSTITKEGLEPVIERLEYYATNVKWTNVQAAQDMLIAVDAMRCLLASLEEEQVGCDACGGNGSVDIDHGEMGIEHIECPKCYAAPPAPVSVPDCFLNAVSALESLYRNGQKQNWNERYTTDMAYASGVIKACRAAMLHGGKS